MSEPVADKPAMQPITDRDAFLAAWVEITNNNPGVDTSVTLLVGGLIVTGMLISITAYHKALGESFAASTADPELQRTWRETFAGMADSYKPQPPDATVPLPYYVHLRDARVMRADGQMIPHNGGVVWRGRLTAVDAWWFGSMESRPG